MGVAAVAVAAAVLLAPAPPAAAHTKLASTEPAADATLRRSPDQVVLTFTESPDVKLSKVRIVDAGGRAAPGVSGVLPAAGERAMMVTLSEALPAGTYTVNWLVVSRDGHVEEGYFTFTVRESKPPGDDAGAPPGGEQSQSPAGDEQAAAGGGEEVHPAGDGVRVPLRDDSPWYRAAAAGGRWLVYVGLALMIGAVATGWGIFGGGLPRGGTRALRAAVAAAVVGLGLITAAQRAAIGAESLLPLFQTRTGELLLALGTCLAACGVAVVLVDFWPARWSLAVLGAAAASASLVHAWSGHASTSALWAPLGIAVHWVHVLAIGAWVGGLAWLLLGLREREGPPLGAAARAFSRVATVALAAAVATGLVRAATELGSPAALAATQYGAGLLAKLSLVAVLVMLGAVSHYRLVPALAAGVGTPGAFRMNSRAEVVLAAAVLATTAVLTGFAPPA